VAQATPSPLAASAAVAGSLRAARNAAIAAIALPPRIAARIRESWWFALLALALYLLLVLYTYDKNDPGWSHSLAAANVHNAGGVVGAYIADLMLYLFGISAYWWVVLCAAAVTWGFRRIESVPETDRRSYAVALAGFAMVLVASSGVEALRLYSLKVILPHAPGGIIGALAGDGLASLLGFTGGTLILLTIFVAGFGLFTGISWLTVIERLGGWLEDAYVYLVAKWQERGDRQAGEQKSLMLGLHRDVFSESARASAARMLRHAHTSRPSVPSAVTA